MLITRLQKAKNQAVAEMLTNLDPCRSKHLCWAWPRYKSPTGYGTIIFDGFKFAVHRLSFEHFKGVIPKGLHVMHECDNRACFNPDHLFLGTHQDNMGDRKRKNAMARLAAEKSMDKKPPQSADEIRREMLAWLERKRA